MGLTLDVGMPALTVFIQGIISFFSPCVLPLIPLYISYLSGGTQAVGKDGRPGYDEKKVFVNTLFFVFGISFAFFALGLGFTAAGQFFSSNRALMARVGAIVVIFFGLYQLGIFGETPFGKEHRLPFKLDHLAMNPLTALLLGFTFSFAWTPCVGPALASVLLMASSASSSGLGFLLIGVYTLGFVLPFLAVGIFTHFLLDLFKKYGKVVAYTVKIGGVLMVLMGIMMWTGWMNGITGYLSGVGNTNPNKPPIVAEASKESTEPSTEQITESASESATKQTTKQETTAKAERDMPLAPDFTLTDQNGVVHTLSDYQGKTIFLNFWATWCGPCKKEIPDIQAVYEAYGNNQEDLVVLGVANPRSADYPSNQDVELEEIQQFIKDYQMTYPVAMDTTGDVFGQYYVSAFPTTFMITPDGRVFGYITGTITRDMMENIIQQTMDASKDQ